MLASDRDSQTGMPVRLAVIVSSLPLVVVRANAANPMRRVTAVVHLNKETGSAANAPQIDSVLDEDHKRKARCNAVVKDTARWLAVRSSEVRKRTVGPSVDHKHTGKHTGKHSAAPPEVKAPIRVAVFREGKRRMVVGRATRPVEVMRLVSVGHAPCGDTPLVWDRGLANADPQHHKATAVLAALGR